MPGRHRRHGMEPKRRVVAEDDAGETLHGLSRRHDVCRDLIRTWIAEAEAGAFDDEVAAAEIGGGYKNLDSWDKWMIRATAA